MLLPTVTGDLSPLCPGDTLQEEACCPHRHYFPPPPHPPVEACPLSPGPSGAQDVASHALLAVGLEVAWTLLQPGAAVRPVAGGPTTGGAGGGSAGPARLRLTVTGSVLLVIGDNLWCLLGPGAVLGAACVTSVTPAAAPQGPWVSQPPRGLARPGPPAPGSRASCFCLSSRRPASLRPPCSR